MEDEERIVSAALERRDVHSRGDCRTIRRTGDSFQGHCLVIIHGVAYRTIDKTQWQIC